MPQISCARMFLMLRKTLQFLNHDIWRIRSRKQRDPRSLGLRAIRIFILSLREFASDKCSLRASALTFFSLLSIVPVFAMAFGLAKGFGLDKVLKEHILKNMEGQQEIITRVIEFSENMLADTRGGLVAGIGLLFLFWTVIKVLSNIESSFNDIWGVKKERTWGRKFSDYLSLMLIAPVFFLVASGATVFVATQVNLATEHNTVLSMLGPVITTAIKILPYTVFWGLLTYLYIFMPNAQIQFSSALIGGVVAGTIYQMVQWAYIHFQIGASNAGAVYGSFAALPLFLMWLQISWLIVLYGAELAFAHQNEQTFEFEPDCLRVSEEMKKLLALRITHLCVRRFCDGQTPLTEMEIADELDTPIRLHRALLHRLTETGVLVIAQGESERERRYLPARDVEVMSIKFVLDRLEKTGTYDVPVAQTPEFERLRAALLGMEQAMERAPENFLLKELPASLPAEIRV